jgi:hypothetical protein
MKNHLALLHGRVVLVAAALLATNGLVQAKKSTAQVTTAPSALRLDMATLLGGTGEDRAHGMAVDGQGNIYLTAPIQSTDFPTTPDALNKTATGIYFAKLSPTGALLYSTYLGAAGGINYAHGIALDKEGNIYIAGNTTNASFPTTPGAFQTTFKGPNDGHHGDAFVVKLSPAGNRILYSTFLGGTGRDICGQIAVDADGNAYVLGSTSSADFPVTPGALQTAFKGGEDQPTGRGDIFVAKLSPDGSKLIYSTYVGGSGMDIYAGNIVVDAAGRATFAGTTTSTDFPVTANAFEKSYRGGSGIRAGGDVVLVQLNPTGTALEYASYVGGRGDDSARSIAVDNTGNVWLAGDTTSDDFPTTADAFSRQNRGGSDCFLLKLNPRGGPLLYSSLLGGSKSDSYAAIAVHPSGLLILAGQTESADFPVTPGAESTTLKGPADLFVALFDPTTKSLRYSTLLGGSGNEVPGPLLLIKDSVYLAGNTTSVDFPVTPGAGDTTYNGGQDAWGGDAFVARFTLVGKSGAPTARTR